MMLKTTLFFLFGCSLYFGQSIANTGSPSNQANPECTDCPMNLNTTEGDGTRTTSSPGQGGTSNFSLMTQQVGNHLNIQLMPQDKEIITYMIYDVSASSLTKDKRIEIHPTNSYSIDISNLNPGNYLITVVEALSNESISRSFSKQ